MRFGYFDNLSDPTQKRDYGDLIKEMRERAAACEQGGMDIFWIPEHHFSIWGRELLPNPLMMAADLAARTSRIRIGLGAAIITFWHPLRLAEDLALLDHLSGGRLEIGVGRGNYGLEAQNLNPLADPNKPGDESQGVPRDARCRVQGALAGAVLAQGRDLPVSGSRVPRRPGAYGQRFRLCGPGDRRTGEADHLSAAARSNRCRRCGRWFRRRTTRFAERPDAGSASSCGGPRQPSFGNRLRVYKEAHDAAFNSDIPLGARTAVVRDTFVADSEAEARRIAEAGLHGLA